MPFPFIPAGISLGVLGLMWLWGRGDENLGVDNKPVGPVGPVGPPNNTWPAGTAVAVVSVDPADPGLQGRAPGVRLRAAPTTSSTLVNTGVPNGTLVAVLSGEIADSEGRKWRKVKTLQGQTAYAPFVGPPSSPPQFRENMKMSPQYPTPWPDTEISAPNPAVAGLPVIAGAPLGWAAWNSGLARPQLAPRMAGAPRFDAIGQSFPTGWAICMGPCLLYHNEPAGSARWTVADTLSAGSTVQVAIGMPVGPSPGPGAGFVAVRQGQRWGWTRVANLRSIARPTLGRRRNVAPSPYPLTVR